MMMREGHENRTDLYDRAKSIYTHPEISDALAHRMASDTRLQPGHPDYLHSGIDRMMVEGQHGAAQKHHDEVIAPAMRKARLEEAMKTVVKGKPETDPRLDPNSEHFAHSGVDQLMINSWHAS